MELNTDGCCMKTCENVKEPFAAGTRFPACADDGAELPLRGKSFAAASGHEGKSTHRVPA